MNLLIPFAANNMIEHGNKHSHSHNHHYSRKAYCCKYRVKKENRIKQNNLDNGGTDRNFFVLVFIRFFFSAYTGMYFRSAFI